MPRAARPLPVHLPDPGFTLLEMLVVLAIAGLIAGLLYPQVETASLAVRQHAARERVAEGAEAAQAMALRSSAPATLGTDENGAVLVVAGAGTRRIMLDPAGQITLAVRPAGIVFHPDGSTTGGELVLVSGSDAARFAVDPASGRLTPIPPASSEGS